MDKPKFGNDHSNFVPEVTGVSEHSRLSNATSNLQALNESPNFQVHNFRFLLVCISCKIGFALAKSTAHQTLGSLIYWMLKSGLGGMQTFGHRYLYE